MEERLQKFLARAGVASRRAAEVIIASGRVAVNGTVVTRMGTCVDPEKDEVRLDTEVVRSAALPGQTPRRPSGGPRPAGTGPRPAGTGPRPTGTGPRPAGPVYLLLHKPAGVLTTSHDDRGRPTVLDLIPPWGRRLFPVGRLDADSEGLLLLTDDGELTNLLTHPRYEVPKTYDLRLRGAVTPEEVRKVERGVWLSEGRTGPARLRIRRRGRNISHVEVTLREGRNRELRRIFARLRHPVLSLRRVSMGPLSLGDLPPGRFRRLTGREVRALYAAARRPGSQAPAPASPQS